MHWAPAHRRKSGGRGDGFSAPPLTAAAAPGMTWRILPPREPT